MLEIYWMNQDGLLTGKASKDIIGEDKQMLLSKMAENISVVKDKKIWNSKLIIDYHYSNDIYIDHEREMERMEFERNTQFVEKILAKDWVDPYVQYLKNLKPLEPQNKPDQPIQQSVSSFFGTNEDQ